MVKAAWVRPPQPPPGMASGGGSAGHWAWTQALRWRPSSSSSSSSTDGCGSGWPPWVAESSRARVCRPPRCGHLPTPPHGTQPHRPQRPGNGVAQRAQRSNDSRQKKQEQESPPCFFPLPCLTRSESLRGGVLVLGSATRSESLQGPGTRQHDQIRVPAGLPPLSPPSPPQGHPLVLGSSGLGSSRGAAASVQCHCTELIGLPC